MFAILLSRFVALFFISAWTIGNLEDYIKGSLRFHLNIPCRLNTLRSSIKGFVVRLLEYAYLTNMK